jgi:hypothetical protein
MERRILVSGHDVVRKVGEPLLPVTLIRVVLHMREDVVFAAAAEQIHVPGADRIIKKDRILISQHRLRGGSSAALTFEGPLPSFERVVEYDRGRIERIRIVRASCPCQQ